MNARISSFTPRDFAAVREHVASFYHARVDEAVAWKRVAKNGDEIPGNAELQILDNDRHPDGKNALTSAGTNYALHAAPAGVVKPANSWNAVRLVVNGQHVEHWLNGAKVVQYELGSADWEARRTSSKFANSTKYGRAKRGFIALQDHGDRVEFRNIRLRELP